MAKTTTDLVIREARLEDAPLIAAFNQAMAEETEGRRLDDATVTRGVERVLKDPGRGRYYLAERGDALAGQTMVTLEWSDWRCGWFWWLQSVYVSPSHRGQGVFRALYRYIHDCCRSGPEACGLRLYVEKRNHHARNIYLRLGMRVADYDMLEEDWSSAEDASAPDHNAGGTS